MPATTFTTSTVSPGYAGSYVGGMSTVGGMGVLPPAGVATTVGPAVTSTTYTSNVAPGAYGYQAGYQTGYQGAYQTGYPTGYQTTGYYPGASTVTTVGPAVVEETTTTIASGPGPYPPGAYGAGSYAPSSYPPGSYPPNSYNTGYPPGRPY